MLHQPSRNAVPLRWRSESPPTFMSLQGQSTLTDDEKRTEAKRHVYFLMEHRAQMTDEERKFVEKMYDSFERFGAKTFVSNKQLFWLRDLNTKC